MTVRAFIGAILVLLLLGCSREAAPGAGEIAENNRAVGLMGMFKYTEAHDLFAGLVERYPDWVDVRVNLAIATLNRQQEGDEAAAMALLESALAQDPDHLRARYCAGLLLYRAADPGALEHLRFVAEAVPDDAYAAYFYGSALEQAGRRDDALPMYRRAYELDPYLRSAGYRLSRILLRSGQTEEGLKLQEEFQKLADNPRARTVDFVYTKMGPNAETVAVAVAEPPTAEAPTGPLFGSAAPLAGTDEEYAFNLEPRRPTSFTAADLDGDGRVDFFVPDALREADVVNAVIVSAGAADYSLIKRHPLATVPGVRAALWGDYDNDGLTDVYLCRAGPNRLLRQGEGWTWTDVTEATGTANGDYDTVDGALFDADHDGDLDIFCVNADGPNELLNNNLDGTFQPIAGLPGAGLAGDGRPSRQVLVTDLDRDRDADIIVINEQPPHDVYVNDRLWAYRQADGFDALRTAAITAAVAGDVDADGQVEIYSAERGPAGDRWGSRWQRGDGGGWRADPLRWPADHDHAAVDSLALADINGDGSINLLAGHAGGVTVLDGSNALAVLSSGYQRGLAGWVPCVIDPARGPAIVGLPDNGVPVIFEPGPGRYAFAGLRFSGMDDPGKSMRSNASGIGTNAAARVASRWTVTDTFRSTSGPGQSLQPVAIGLGGAPAIDFVSIDWPDGVFQSEIDLAAGEHLIREEQRQVSSCPVLFAFNGTAYEFVSDLLGVGGIGYMVAPGEYAIPRPWENFMLGPEQLRPRDGHYRLKLGEPMEEACYVNTVGLVVYDLPPGWSMTLDERMGILGPQPTGEPRYYRRLVVPARAVNDRGRDVTELVSAAELRAAPVGALDRRFIGRLETPNVVTLRFDEPLAGRPILVADGWIEYPYSQTMFGAWQAGADFVAPTVEARGADGRWHVVLEQFGYPAGMPRQMSVPLDGLPPGTVELRISTNQEIYWDRLAVAFAEPSPEVRRTALPLSSASVQRSGFARRSTGPQRLPHYDYQDRSPFWDTRHQAGWYTAFGDAEVLVTEDDGALAIFGPGEELHVEFDAVAPPPPAGWTRCFVLETRGWCKDMDLFTRDGETVGPLPGTRDARGEALHRQHNTRYEAGKP